MCGICGFTGNLPDGKEVLTRMMDRISHRGPDSAGQFINDKAAWGFRRLSIIDLDNGSQPMFNEDNSVVIVFNGEIYNYKILRRELEEKGHVFRNNADTEVLVHGYEEWGTDLPNHCRGMFAFMIYDMNTDTAFGARDYFGIKPFYYTVIDGNLIFASEIKSILEYPKYEKQVNKEALEEYLTFQYSVLPETFFKGIFKLPPAHTLVFKDGKADIKRYWEPDYAIDEQADMDELVDAIDARMEESVRTHMISDVEVGSLLSSGIDSSYIAALSHADKTFTVGFDYDRFNEISYAQDLSKRIGTRNYSKLITEAEYWDVLPEIQYYMDEPLADASCVALYFVDKTAAEHVKVVLSGEGADEFFGGYNIYHEPVSLRKYQKLPRFVRVIAGKLTDFHRENDIQSAVDLIGSLPPDESSIDYYINGWEIYMTDSFRLWFLERVSEEGTALSTPEGMEYQGDEVTGVYQLGDYWVMTVYNEFLEDDGRPEQAYVCEAEEGDGWVYLGSYQNRNNQAGQQYGIE